LALDVLGWGVRGLFAFVALGIVAFSLVLAFSTTRGRDGADGHECGRDARRSGRPPEDRREAMAVGTDVRPSSPWQRPTSSRLVQSLVLIADGWFRGRLGTRSWRRWRWSSPADHAADDVGRRMGGGVSLVGRSRAGLG